MTRRTFIKKAYKAPLIVALSTLPTMAAQQSGFVPPACRNNQNLPVYKG